MFQAAAYALALSYLVLVLTTKNYQLATIAMLSIFCVLASIAGTLALLGWELNVTESVVFSIAVGMSVDFVAHFAEGAWRSRV